MKPHKHAELIKAWVEGAEIEWVYATQGDGTKLWAAIPHPVWYESHEYRIKPEPKPDVVKYGLLMFNETATPFTKDYQRNDNIKLTWDGETGELKSAEVLK